jgi:3-hydroxyisobutyrate dehydrogenase-like beta-hydroxyacid dehydrogenase
MKKRIGFMGLGSMGRAMAANLLKAGFPVTVYNRDKQKTLALADMGALTADTPRQLAGNCDVAILMVTGPEAIDELLFGIDGAAEGLAGKLCVNMSSVSPAYSRELAASLEAEGAVLIDAPVSGTKKPAEDGLLVILASGPEQTVRDLGDVFRAMGRKVVYCGPAGQGSMMKMTVNHLLGVMMHAFAEALLFGERGGLSMDAMMETIQSGAMACPMYQAKAPLLASGNYPASFPLKHMAKDLKYVLDTAYETGAHIPAAQAALGMYLLARERGLGDMDFAAVDKAMRDMLKG